MWRALVSDASSDQGHLAECKEVQCLWLGSLSLLCVFPQESLSPQQVAVAFTVPLRLRGAHYHRRLHVHILAHPPRQHPVSLFLHRTLLFTLFQHGHSLEAFFSSYKVNTSLKPTHRNTRTPPRSLPGDTHGQDENLSCTVSVCYIPRTARCLDDLGRLLLPDALTRGRYFCCPPITSVSALCPLSSQLFVHVLLTRTASVVAWFACTAF